MSMSYEVFAIQYATSMRPARDYVLNPHDAHDGLSPIHYYVWAIRGAGRSILVDTGFDEARAASRGRHFIRCPTESLTSLGMDPRSIDTVVITHLHYDHAGNLDKFPGATFVLQDEEMRFATGRSMRFPLMRAAFELSDVQAMLAYNYAGRIRFVTGSETIAPGVAVHHVPGHTAGLQCVTVETARGRLCLASDAAHFFANLSEENPFPILSDVAAVLEGQRLVQRLADSPDHVIPGHDPLVMDLFPAAGDPLVRELSAPPLGRLPLPPGGY